MSKVNSVFIALIAVFYAAVAHASLGGDSTSVETDRVLMKVEHSARQTTSTNGSYTVHETVLSTGTIVKQYVSKAGVVFAVSWSGPFIPNLRQLLGSHFDTMVTHQAQQAHAGHRYNSQREPGLVIESGGHPRSYVGRAYLPSEVPAGVSAQEIK